MRLSELQKTYGIGLTGGIASGKSTVAKIIAGQNYLVIDADQLAREAVLPGTAGLAAIASAFGGKALNADGTLNRTELSHIVFEDSAKRAHLESIVHPAIQALLSKRLETEGLYTHPAFWFYE